MRIQDKYKAKTKPSSAAGGGGNTNPAMLSSTTASPVVSIHACVESGDLTGVQRLLTQDPSSLNQRSIFLIQTPLHVAAGHNRIDILKYLLEWRGSVKLELEANNVYGETPLHEAAKNGFNDAVATLLQHGANIEARTNLSNLENFGRLHMCNTIVDAFQPTDAIFCMIRRHGLLTSGDVHNSMTPLHLAVGYALTSGNNSVVKTLYEYNANFSAEDDEGMIPFNYLPSGVENDELMLLCQIVEEPRDYEECGMKGKMDEFNFELSKIVGLEELKAQLRKWAKGMLLDEKRRAMGVDLGPRKAPHMAFLGNPGTGKTTVARILGKLLCSLGVLSSDKVTEVQRSDLVGEFLGQTGPKTRTKIEEAMGGILFVDEAYRLTPTDSGNSIEYGVEALEEIMSVLEDGDLLVIFAGYTEPMRRVFSSNAGFCRRVTHFFQFDDFSCRELAEMLMIKMSKRDERSRLFGFRLGSCCGVEAVASVIERKTSETMRSRMNGGLVDHMLNNARESLDSRLSFEAKGDELLTIKLGDLEAGLDQLVRRLNLDGVKV